MKPFTALLGAAAGTHAADQLALATLPLTATLVLGAGPDVLGLLVAAQSAAWLLISLPAGAWIDRMPRRTLLIVGLGLGLLASIVAAAAAAAGIATLLGVAAFVGASGTVVYVLTSVSLLPSLVPPADLSRSNARLGLARAGGAGRGAARAAVRHPDLRARRVGDRRRPVPRGCLGRPLGERLCLRGRRPFPGGLRPDAVADLPDHGAPAGDADAVDGPGQ